MKKILVLLVAICFTATINAQQIAEEPAPIVPQKRFAVSAHPMWWLNNAFRFDFEFRLRQTPAWLQISPTIHALSPEYDNNYYDGNYTIFSGDGIRRMSGFGIEVNYKYFINKTEAWYVAGGLSYNYYRLQCKAYSLTSYMEHGLEYHLREYGMVSQKINKIGMNAYIGYRVPRGKHFLTEFFTGLGYRHSFMNNPAAPRFDNSMISPGHTGFVFIVGLKLGAKFY